MPPSYQKIGKPLETNHFGNVYKGFEFEGQRDVRIVEFHERFAADANRWNRIWHDVQSMMKCQHQNLVPVFALSREDRQVITEWLPFSLSSVSPEKSLTHDDVRQVLLQSLDGLSEIHDHGLIHGNISQSACQ